MNSINQVATAFEKESALMLTLKSAKVTALTAATAAYSAVTGTTTGLLKAFKNRINIYRYWRPCCRYWFINSKL